MINATMVNQIFIGVATAAVLMFTNSITESNKEQLTMNNNMDKRVTIIEQKMDVADTQLIDQKIKNAAVNDEIADMKLVIGETNREILELQEAMDITTKSMNAALHNLQNAIEKAENRLDNFIDYFQMIQQQKQMRVETKTSDFNSNEEGK